MKFGKEYFLKGKLPKILEQPECNTCTEKKAFILSEDHGLICGNCFMKFEQEKKVQKALIMEKLEKLII